jgi:hypothetical protein
VSMRANLHRRGRIPAGEAAIAFVYAALTR